MTIMLTLSDDDIRKIDEVRKVTYEQIELQGKDIKDFNLSPPSLMRALMRMGAEHTLEYKCLLPELQVKK